MKTTLLSLIAALILLPAVTTAQNKFIGVKACVLCHKTEKQGTQLAIWQKSGHAEAYKTLLSEKSIEIAKKQGLKKPAHESPECLSCHAPEFKETARFEKNFDIKDGVQCETCHGAGSGYKASNTMKDHAKSVAAGMVEFKDEAAIKAHCITCHNKKSPTYREFKFAEMWEKMKHPVPKK